MTYRDDCYVYGRIPAQPFMDVVADFISRMEMGERVKSSFGYDNARAVPEKYSATEAVADWSGVSWDHLQKILKGRFQSVTFDLADKVICATVGPDAWHSDPELNKQYNRVSLAAA